MNKSKINLPFSAMLLALVVTFTQSAFKPTDTNKAQIKLFRYNNSTATNISQTASWTDVTGTDPDQCNSGPALPCVIELDVDVMPLSTFLSTHDSASEIIDSDQIRSTKSGQ
jgi:hypothetical protein